jgi:hypothetical protein
MYVCVYIYIEIERERAREKGVACLCVCVCVWTGVRETKSEEEGYRDGEWGLGFNYPILNYP